MDYCSAIKKNEIRPFAATWMDLQIIILSKSHREKQIPYDITYMWNLKYEGFPGGTVVESPPANAGDTGSSPGPGGSHMPWSN